MILFLLTLSSGCTLINKVTDSFNVKAPIPDEFEIDIISASGVQIDLPSWIKSEADEKAVADCIDEYFAVVEEKLGKKISRHNLIVQIVEDRKIKRIYSGYYWWANMRYGAGRTWMPFRMIALTWSRNFIGNYAEGNPFPALPHELMHDDQYWNNHEIDHNWTDIQEEIATMRPDITCELED
jgi:hypothetical protein